MALPQSALSELLDAFRAGDGVDFIRDAVRLVLQDLIELEATGRVGRRTRRSGQGLRRAAILVMPEDKAGPKAALFDVAARKDERFEDAHPWEKTFEALDGLAAAQRAFDFGGRIREWRFRLRGPAARMRRP